MHVALPKSRGQEKQQIGEQRLGFLAANRDPEFGYVGGFMITTARGRPLEFHYTSPVKPSPTHRILYGAELEPYIFGELIAANLLRQSTVELTLLITDQPLVLSLRPDTSSPVICVSPLQAEAAGAAAAPEFRTHPNHTQDLEFLQGWLSQRGSGLDLREPFGRVWEALREILGAETRTPGVKQVA